MSAERKQEDADRSVRIGRWLGAQYNNVEQSRREAARHVMGRWDVTSPWFSMARIMRTLEREESPFLPGFRALCDDFASQFEEDAVKDIGSTGPFTPYEVTRCIDCKREAVPGSDRCGRHGGQFLSAQDASKISRHTAARIIDATDRAVGVLVDLLDHGKSEKVRFDAAVAILDRAGHGPTSKIELDVNSGQVDAAALVAERLQGIEASIAKANEITASRADPGVVVDVEATLEPDPEAEPET